MREVILPNGEALDRMRKVNLLDEDVPDLMCEVVLLDDEVPNLTHEPGWGGHFFMSTVVDARAG